MKWEKLTEVREYEAEMIKDMLEKEGIPVLIKPLDYAPPVFVGAGGMVEVLVPESELERAKEIVSWIEE